MTAPVILLSTNLARGGAETQVALLASGLRGRNWPVEVVSLIEPTAFQSELAAAGVPVHSLGIRPGGVNPLAIARLARILRRVRPRVLHTHMFHANLLGRLTRLLFPIPRLIGTLHSIAESGRNSTRVDRRDRLYRLTDPLADVTVAVSQAAADRHAASGAVSRGKLTVIPNGVDGARFQPDAEARSRLRAELGISDEFLWLAAGRLIWKKDYATLLGALERLDAGVLCIAGAGPLEAELREQARPLGARVRFLGARDDLPALMNAADGLALSSVVEGMPMALLEAAASGLPCVATRAGGADEVVVDGKTGFLAPSSDRAALAAAMTRLAGLPAASRAAMGRAARERALSQFDIRLIVGKWEELYLQS
jgi:glycosyltransferase involved in cell wall biosynthesis